MSVDDNTPGTIPDIDTAARNRNRGLLLLILAMFFGSMLVAGVLRFSGWQPEGRKNHGELLDPPVDLREARMSLAGGGTYAWGDDARTWRILAAPPADCGDACATLAGNLDTVWRLFGKDADRVHVLWLCAQDGCAPPADARLPDTLRRVHPDLALRAALPGVDDPSGIPLYVVDPNGFVILRYPPGSDPGGLRADLAKLLKLI